MLAAHTYVGSVPRLSTSPAAHHGDVPIPFHGACSNPPQRAKVTHAGTRHGVTISSNPIRSTPFWPVRQGSFDSIDTSIAYVIQELVTASPAIQHYKLEFP